MLNNYTEPERDASKLWESFKEAVYHKNRFFVSHPLLDFLRDYVLRHESSIDNGSVFYRARIIDEQAKGSHNLKLFYNEDHNYKRYFSKSNHFRCLTKEASFVPINNDTVKDGRANPRFIKYLYMAESPVTAIFEVRPLLTDHINLAEIIVNQKLRLADLSYDSSIKQEYMLKDQFILSYIRRAFSYPTNNSNDYIPSQIIAEYIKTLGYDGIRYNSSLHKKGINLTIYNFDKCEAISSCEIKIEDIKLDARNLIGSDLDNRTLYIKDNEYEFINVMKDI